MTDASIFIIYLTVESLQIQMGLSFPFLRAKDLRMFLLIMRTRSFFTLLFVGGTFTRLVYIWYKKNIPHDRSTDSILCSKQGKNPD